MANAVELATAYVSIVPETSKIAPGLRDALKVVDKEGDAAGKRLGSKLSGGIGAAFKGGLGIAAGAIAGAGIVDFFKDSISGASDLAESTNKLQQVFGPATKQVTDFAAKGARALGMTNLAARDAASTFGIFGKSAGLTGKDLGTFSTSMAGLATDLASFHNTSPEEAIDALGAALRGESEPMRRYGVLLDDASLRQQAMAMGLTKSTKESLTPANKVLAAQALIMAKTKDAQGDFARTTGGLANQQRILSATLDDSKAAIGSALLPAVTAAAVFLNDTLIPAFGKVSGAISGIWDLLVNGNFGDALRNAFGWEEDSAQVDFLFNVRDGLIEAWGAAQKFGQGVLEFWKSDIQPTLQSLWQTVQRDVLPVLVGFFRDTMLPILKDFGSKVQEAWDIIQPALVGLWQIIRDDVAPAISWMWSNVVGPVFSKFGEVVSTFWFKIASPALSALFTFVKKFLMPTISSLWTNVAKPTFELMGALIKLVWEKFISPAMDSMKGAFEGIGTVVSFMWDKVLKPTFGFLVSTFLAVAKSIVKTAAFAFGWIPGIGEKLQTAADKFDIFESDVNKALLGIDDQTVNVGVQFKAGSRLAYDLRHQGFATGGPVFGPGSGTSDSIPAMLSNGEHILTAAEVQAAGGHQAIMAWRKSLRGFAGGGPVLATSLPSMAGISSASREGLLDTVAANLKMLKSALAPDGGNAIGWRAMVEWARQHLPWLTVTSTTGGKHAPNSWHYKGRAIDLAGPNMVLATKILHDAFPGAKELFHTYARAYQIKNGRPFPGVIPGHGNHIHLALAGGGYVSGAGTSTSDSVLARLSNGEYVMKAAAVRRHGIAAMDAINNGASTAGIAVNIAGSVDQDILDRLLSELDRRQRAANFRAGVSA